MNINLFTSGRMNSSKFGRNYYVNILFWGILICFNSINFLSLVKYFPSVTCRIVERDYLPDCCQVQLPTLCSRVMTSYSLTLSLCSYCFLTTDTSLQFMSAVRV